MGKNMEDYMRCKVINFPIGVLNEARRRDAFKTWIITREISDVWMKDKDKKMLFVCTFNPVSQEIKYVKNICVTVETKVETLGQKEHMNLGTVKVTDEFLNHVRFGVEDVDEVSSKIFLRRVFPVQDESDSKAEKLAVSEVVKGQLLTHVDDCHVLVIQQEGDGTNFDQFIKGKIRETAINIEPRKGEGPDFKSY